MDILKLQYRPQKSSMGWAIVRDALSLCSVTGWEEERVSSPSILRLIFQGRFLHGNVTLGGKTISEQRHHH